MGRSRCPQCRRTLSYWEIIPIISFLILRARCRTCHKQISWQYPLIELASGLLFLGAMRDADLGLLYVSITALSLWLMLLIAVVDFQTGLIPDALSLPLIAIAVLRPALWWLVGIWFVPVYLFLVFEGAFVAAGFFAIQWIVSRGRWVGTGDILLAAGIGFFLIETSRVALAIAIAYIVGAGIASYLLVTRRKNLKSELAFGPLLVAGAFVTYFFGDAILQFFTT